MRYSFSGHESFHCKSLWLKKGYDFICNKKHFADTDSVVELGVGKNTFLVQILVEILFVRI